MSFHLKRTLLLFFAGVVLAVGVFSVVSCADTKLSPEVLSTAQKAYARFRNAAGTRTYMIIIDYTRPFFAKRLWLMDMNTQEIILNAHVTHALNSGLLYARRFSNVTGTKQSCCGAFLTEDAFQSKFGQTMRVSGLEKGINDKAEERGIWFHPSYLLWTRGCYATFPRVNKRLIELTENKAFLYVYSPSGTR